MRWRRTLAHWFHPRRSNYHRARVLHPEILVSLAILCIVTTIGLQVVATQTNSFSQVLGYASSITPQQVLEETNQRRSAQQLSSLQLNPELSQAALAKAQHMFANQYWSHTAPDGTEPWFFIQRSGYTYQVAGENLARDFADTSSMVEAWMASPTHQANILNNRYQDIGIAVVDGSLQGIETTLVVQLFGAPPTAARPEVEAGQMVTALPSTSIQLASVPETSSVLSDISIQSGGRSLPPILSPLQLSKMLFLGFIMIIVLTLVYDSLVVGHHATMRLVGHNLAHILLFLAVGFLVLLFRGGIVG